jgi:hypothetical protein
MEQKKSEAVHLSSEDSVRMRRLYEEVVGRLEEMSLIIARTLGKSPRDRARIVFNYQLTSSEHVRPPRELRLKGTELIVYDDGSCACHDYDEEMCYPC